MRFVGQSFSDQLVNLDDNQFESCKFTRCQLVLKGSGPVGITNCEFYGIALIFDGPAAMTLNVLGSMFTGGFSSLIETVFDGVRSGKQFPVIDSLPSGAGAKN